MLFFSIFGNSAVSKIQHLCINWLKIIIIGTVDNQLFKSQNSEQNPVDLLQPSKVGWPDLSKLNVVQGVTSQDTIFYFVVNKKVTIAKT